MAIPMIKARPTTYKGIQMRSRLEAYFAAMLDGWPGATWEYEPVCFAGPQNQWIPDFRITHREESCADAVEYAEVKPWVTVAGSGEDRPGDGTARREAVDLILAKMETAWLNLDGPASLALYFAESEDGAIGSHLTMLTCECPGEGWRWGTRDDQGIYQEIAFPATSGYWPGLGQGHAVRQGGYAALREHSITRMRELGIEVPR